MVLDKYIGAWWNKLWSWFRKGATFILVSALWVPFRAESMTHMGNIFSGMRNRGIDTASEFYQTILPQTAAIIRASGLIADNILLMIQKISIFGFVLILLFVVFVGKDVAYLREKYSSQVWMIIVCGVILSISVMQFSTTIPDFIYEGF